MKMQIGDLRMIMSKTKRSISLILIMCMVFATSSYVKAYEDDDLWYPDASKTTLATNNLTMYKTANGCAYGEVALVNPPDLSDYFFSYSKRR